MTTAALAQLKEALPGVRTGVIVNERNRDLFSLCPLADELVPDGLASALRQRGRWDIYLDYPRTFNTTAILFAFCCALCCPWPLTKKIKRPILLLP